MKDKKPSIFVVNIIIIVMWLWLAVLLVVCTGLGNAGEMSFDWRDAESSTALEAVGGLSRTASADDSVSSRLSILGEEQKEKKRSNFSS